MLQTSKQIQNVLDRCVGVWYTQQQHCRGPPHLLVLMSKSEAWTPWGSCRATLLDLGAGRVRRELMAHQAVAFLGALSWQPQVCATNGAGLWWNLSVWSWGNCSYGEWRPCQGVLQRLFFCMYASSLLKNIISHGTDNILLFIFCSPSAQYFGVLFVNVYNSVSSCLSASSPWAPGSEIVPWDIRGFFLIQSVPEQNLVLPFFLEVHCKMNK